MRMGYCFLLCYFSQNAIWNIWYVIFVAEPKVEEVDEDMKELLQWSASNYWLCGKRRLGDSLEDAATS